MREDDDRLRLADRQPRLPVDLDYAGTGEGALVVGDGRRQGSRQATPSNMSATAASR